MQGKLNELIKYRVEQAHKTINEVDLLIEQNLLVIAINRIYYGMFYVLLALALKEGFKTSKHKQLIGWFNKEYIKTEKIDRKIGKHIQNAYEDRSDGDYGVFVQFKKEEVQDKFRSMKIFIETVEGFLDSQ